MTPEILDQLSLCQHIITDLDDLLEEVLEGKPTPDEISNILIGVMQLNRIRFSKLERIISDKYPNEHRSVSRDTNSGI
jgi:hypothetical protein